MRRLASRRVVITLLLIAALLGLVSTADAGTGIALLAIATVPAVFAVPPRARRWLGAVVAVIGVGAGALGDLDGDALTWCAVAALAIAGALILFSGANWPALSGRYDRSRDGGAEGGPSPDPNELWRELDRGHDPTRSPPRDAVDDKEPPEGGGVG